MNICINEHANKNSANWHTTLTSLIKPSFNGALVMVISNFRIWIDNLESTLIDD